MKFGEFSVHPRRSGAPLMSCVIDRRGALGALEAFSIDEPLSGWSDDREVYYFQGEPIQVNPFTISIVGRSRRDGQRSDSDVVEDFLYGRDCNMDEAEWGMFCREVLLLGAPIAQTMDGVAGMVDEMMVSMVRAVVGREEFSVKADSRLMELVVVLVRFLMLCGGSGVLPREYLVARFGGGCPLRACAPVAEGQGRAFALKVVRRLVSLGRCVRGMLRVAWNSALWLDPILVGALGLDVGKEYYLCDIWRAAMGVDTPMGVLCRMLLDPRIVLVGHLERGILFMSLWLRHGIVIRSACR